jgi:hypothetical protein
MDMATDFLVNHGFSVDDPEYWHNLEGDYLMNLLIEAESFDSSVEFVFAKVEDAEGYVRELIGYMFPDESIIMDDGETWLHVDPSWEFEDGSTVLSIE